MRLGMGEQTDQHGGLEGLADRVRRGDHVALARALTIVEEGGPAAAELVRLATAARAQTGAESAHIVGLTGAPGVGKSSLADRLIRCLRADRAVVGVVAIDPTSPFSGGAILGDRSRMQEHALDPGVFIRSLASRGAPGALSEAAGDVILLLTAWGCDTVLVETVGAGQSDVQVMNLADTCVVVLEPGFGDDLQALKAGIFEIADIFVMNKSDRPDAPDALRRVRSAVSQGAAGRRADGWAVPVLATCATAAGEPESGVTPVVRALQRHREFLRASGEGHRRRRRAAEERLLAVVSALAVSRVRRMLGSPEVAGVLEEVVDRKLDPYTAAERILTELHLLGEGRPWISG